MENKKNSELVLHSLFIILVKTKETFTHRPWNKTCCDGNREAPLVKCLLDKHKDLRSILRTQKRSSVVHACGTREVETGGSLEFSRMQSSLTGELLTNRKPSAKGGA